LIVLSFPKFQDYQLTKLLHLGREFTLPVV